MLGGRGVWTDGARAGGAAGVFTPAAPLQHTLLANFYSLAMELAP